MFNVILKILRIEYIHKYEKINDIFQRIFLTTNPVSDMYISVKIKHERVIKMLLLRLLDVKVVSYSKGSKRYQRM